MVRFLWLINKYGLVCTNARRMICLLNRPAVGWVSLHPRVNQRFNCGKLSRSGNCVVRAAVADGPEDESSLSAAFAREAESRRKAEAGRAEASEAISFDGGKLRDALMSR